MPLVVITGYPSSGKSRRASELKEELENVYKVEVTIISENSFLKNKNEVFTDATKEKELRGKIKSEVQRLVNINSITVVDAGNGIKGFRYELYCISKAIPTSQCTIHCDAQVEDVVQINENRAQDEAYSLKTLHNSIDRYESPIGTNRWDKPLFVITPANAKLPIEDIYNCLYKNTLPCPNNSTTAASAKPTTYLYNADQITSSILKKVMDSQKMFQVGMKIPVPRTTESIELSKPVTLPELLRQKRLFLSYIKLNHSEEAQIPYLFVKYLNLHL